MNASKRINPKHPKKQEKTTVCLTMKELHRAIHSWEDMIDKCGNQCAASDRIIEKIISLSVQLQQAYDKEIPPVL